MALRELFYLAFGHLKVNLQQRLLIHRALVLRIDLLERPFEISHLLTLLLIILAEALLQALISVLDLIQLNVQLKVLFDLRLQIHQHILLALGKGSLDFIHLLGHLRSGDLFDIDGSRAGYLLVELGAEFVTLPQRVSLGSLESLSSLNYLVLVGHQTRQVFGCQQEEVVVPCGCVHLLLADGVFPSSYQVEQLVGLLPRTLLLAYITLDELSKFGGPRRHGALSTHFLTVVGLCLLLELLDDLVLLTQLEVELAQLILQDGREVILLVLLLLVRLGLRGSLSLCTATSSTLLLLLILLLRNDKVLRLYLLDLCHGVVVRLFDEVLATGEDLDLGLQLFDLIILVLDSLGLLLDREVLVAFLGVEHVTLALECDQAL